MDKEEFQDFPVISEELMRALDLRYPDVMPNSADLGEIYRLQGQVSVVRLLKEVRKAQTDNIFSTET